MLDFIKRYTRKKSAIISATLNSILNTSIQKAHYKQSSNECRYIRNVSYLVNKINIWNLREGT